MANAYLQGLADMPISSDYGGCKLAGQRAAKIWLPEGKKSASSVEAKEAKAAFYERQIDLEEAVAAAGGTKGSMGRAQ